MRVVLGFIIKIAETKLVLTGIRLRVLDEHFVLIKSAGVSITVKEGLERPRTISKVP